MIDWFDHAFWHAGVKAAKAERALVSKFELVAFEFPPGIDMIPRVEWELLGGPKRMTPLTDGQTSISGADRTSPH